MDIFSALSGLISWWSEKAFTGVKKTYVQISVLCYEPFSLDKLCNSHDISFIIIKMEIMHISSFEKLNDIECEKEYISASSEIIHSQVFVEHISGIRSLGSHFI